jgi:hypothetical protein
VAVSMSASNSTYSSSTRLTGEKVKRTREESLDLQTTRHMEHMHSALLELFRSWDLHTSRYPSQESELESSFNVLTLIDI